jgi:hypothetical protein
MHDIYSGETIIINPDEGNIALNRQINALKYQIMT